MAVRLLIGDCRARLAELPAQSVHTCVTSPPYFGLRDYGVAGQIGLEDTPEAFVAQMVDVFREVRRVLRDDGTLWLNLGDSYAGSWGAQSRGNATGEDKATISGSSTLSARQIEAHPRGQTGTGSLKNTPGLKAKDLIGIPWRVAFALQADGWYLRQDIIWAKPNPMPESVRDRCTKAHEYLFLLSKGPRYHYDAEAIAETALYAETRNGRVGAYQVRAQGGGGDGTSPTAHADRDLSQRNRRSVWTVATQPFKEAHFATYPPELIEPCILAGCPAGGTVLDPFGGAGTTGLVADRLQRDAILIELNPTYAEIARKRLQGDGGMFSEVEAA